MVSGAKIKGASFLAERADLAFSAIWLIRINKTEFTVGD